MDLVKRTITLIRHYVAAKKGGLTKDEKHALALELIAEGEAILVEIEGAAK